MAITFRRTSDDAVSHGFEIVLDGRALLRGCHVSVAVTGAADAYYDYGLTPPAVRILARRVGTPPAAGLALQLNADDGPGGSIFLSATVTNTGAESARIDTISPLHWTGTSDIVPDHDGAGGFEGWTVWVQGQRMTSDTLTLRPGSGEEQRSFSRMFLDEWEQDVAWTSHAMTVLSSPDRAFHLLIGFVTLGARFTECVVDASDTSQPGRPGFTLQSLLATCRLEGRELRPGESATSETLMLAAGPDPWALAEQYAGEVARRMGARVPDQVPTGWCSWYYFYNRVTEADIRSNLDALGRLPYRLDYVQIDDGFQSATGDWLTPNQKFPSGMQPLAEAIGAAGFRPGLWLAPFTVNTGSRLFAEHPEWLLHDAFGQVIVRDIWLGPCAGLDCTHPGAQAWLRNLIRTVVNEWGYTFLKLDALFTACYDGAVFHDRHMTTAANLRRGLEIIRDTAGDDTFILGCSCPFGPAIGLVDAMRVGPDVEARWFAGANPSVKHALRLSLPRSWMHGRWWLNDPDCLTVRDNESSLSLEEARFCATGIALSGGLTVLSDDLATLSPKRREIALAALPPTGRAARPLDLLDRETPAIWIVPSGEGSLTVAVLNWDDEPMSACVTWQALGITGPRRVRERWTSADLGTLTDELAVEHVPAHAARWFVLEE